MNLPEYHLPRGVEVELLVVEPDQLWGDVWRLDVDPALPVEGAAVEADLEVHPTLRLSPRHDAGRPVGITCFLQIG